MITRRTFHWAISSLIAVALLSACRSEIIMPVLESVPDNAVSVKVVNLSRLLKMSGCNVGDEADQELVKLVDFVVKPDYREPFLRLIGIAGGVDLGNVTSFSACQGTEFVVMHVADVSLLRNGVEEAFGKKVLELGENVSGVECNGCVIAFNDAYCWLAPDEGALRLALNSARHSHFGTLAGVRDFLTTSAVAKVAVNCGRSPLAFLGGRDKWLCMDFNVTDVSVSAGAVVMNRDGECDSIGRHFKPINTDFLRYTPSDAAVVLAFGKFDGNERGLSMLLGRYAPVYLAHADGTTSLYAVPAAGAEAVAAAGPGSWNVETMVHVPEDLLAVGIEQYKERANGEAVNIGDQWHYNIGDDNYYFGAFDGCLVFSTNREISSLHNNEFSDFFQGKRAAMIVDVPAHSVLSRAWQLPYGVTFRIAVDAMCVKARIVFHDSGDNALMSLLKMPQLPDFRERFTANAGL